MFITFVPTFPSNTPHPYINHEPLKTSHGITVAVQIVKLHIELFKCTLYTLVEQYSEWLNS